MPRLQFPFYCLIAVLALSLAGSGAAVATPGEIHVVAAYAVAVRAGPGDGHKVVARLDRDTRVMEFERRGRWLRVQPMGTVGKMGWVPQKLLKPEPPPPPPAPPPSAAAEPPEPPVYIEERREIYIVKPPHRHRRPPMRKRPARKPVRKPTLMVPRGSDDTETGLR